MAASSPSPGDAYEPRLRTLRILWGAFVASLALYAAVAALVAERPNGSPDAYAALMWILAFVSALNLLTIMPVSRALVGLAKRRGAAPGSLLAAHQIAFVVALARVEAVALFGLVLVLVSGRQDWFSLFLGVAALGLMLLFPRRRDLEGLASQPARDSGPIEP